MSTAAADDGDALVGRIVVERYRIKRPIAVGGMGAVYEAEHIGIGRRVAVKLVRADLMHDDKALARFELEARSAGALENDHICAVLDIGTGPDGRPCLVMEYLRGQNLAELLDAEGPLPVVRAVGIAEQVCRGLAAAHARRIVHRDLKPKNLIVCQDSAGRDLIKIVDFGIAKQHSSDAASATTTGATMGTPHYMSPEQARGEKQLDERTDIYTLGVILYELLSGHKPHPGESYNAIIYHILSKQPEPLRSLRPEVPEGLAKVVHRAMAVDTEARFASVRDFERALAPYSSARFEPLAADAETVSGPALAGETGPVRRTRILVSFAAGAALAAMVTWMLPRAEGARLPSVEPVAHASASPEPIPKASAVALKDVASAEPVEAPPSTSAPASVKPPATASRRSVSPRPRASAAATAAPSKGGYDTRNPYE